MSRDVLRLALFDLPDRPSPRASRLRQLATALLLTSLPAAVLRAQTPPPQQRAYGTVFPSAYTIGAYDFIPVEPGAGIGFVEGSGSRFLTTAGSVAAPIHVPSGAQFTSRS